MPSPRSDARRTRGARKPSRSHARIASRRASARAVILLAAYPGLRPAEREARRLVRARVLACATVVPGGRAFYRWKGSEHADPSVLLIGKTVSGKAASALEAIREGHPDEVPEILVVPVAGGHAPYLAWLAAETS
jgi:periplasmic divalent cation tolerance protein